MHRIMRMMMARTGKIPKERTDISDDGFIFRVTVQDDREFDWFKNVSVQVFKESSLPSLKYNCVSSGTAQTDQSTKKRQGSNTDMASEGGKRQKMCAETLSSKVENNELREEDSDDESTSDDSEKEDEKLDDEPSSEEWESEDEDAEHAIGNGFARLISRGPIRSDFWENMEEPSQDTMALAFDVFDRFGAVRPEFVNGSRRGSGIWGAEVREGDFLQVELISVNRSHQRQGLATKILKHLHDKAVDMEANLKFSFAWPTQINGRDLDGLPKSEYEVRWTEGHNAAICLFRKAGYRRIGTTNWLAFAFDPEHSSHQISPEVDYDPAEFVATPLEEFLEKLERSRTKNVVGTGAYVISDKFRGYSDEDVQTIFALRGQEVPETTSSAFLKTKFGCTCGDCLGGFISPTMKHTLFHQAEMKYDLFEDLAMTLRDDGADMSNDEDLFFLWPGLELLPEPVKPFIKSNKSVAEGYRMMFLHVSVCLKRKIVPTIKNVFEVARDCEEWPPHTKNFLEKGYVRESISAVLQTLFDVSHSQDEKAGDGMFMEFLNPISLFGEAPPPESPGTRALRNEKEQAESKPCRNDSEFGFVLGMLVQA